MRSKLLLLFIAGPLLCYAQQGKFKMNGYQQDDGCPIFSSVDKKTGDRYYDSRVIGYPRFFPGYIVLINGERVEGNIALFNDQVNDWSFVKRCLLIVPEGEEEAQYLNEGVVVIKQEKKKDDVFYDLYKGGFLERLVSGSVRLSYNPDANTTNNISQFVSQSFLDSVRANTAKKSIRESMKEGESMQAAIGKAAFKDQLFEIGNAIEITEKEYLLYNEKTGVTRLIKRDNYEQGIAELFKTCSSVEEKKVRAYQKNFGKIEDAIKAYNEVCK